MSKTVFNIILADDHELLISSLREMINDEDNLSVVGTVNTGLELIDLVRETNIDLCIIDLNMPGISGLETSEILLKQNPEIKILILTMHKEKSLIKKMVSMGVKGYLPKTCDKDEFIFAINQILKDKIYFSNILIEDLIKEEIYQENNPSAFLKISLLTEREEEIIHHLCQGLNNKQIAAKLFVSHKTIGNHRSNIMQKLDVHHIVELMRFCIKHGLEE